jgi:cytochrome c peroxidase
MQKLKLAAIAAFMIGLIGFTLMRSDIVEGQAGGATLAAPTSVLATDSVYNTKVGVYWDAIRGASTYRIFRNTSNTTTGATDVGTTAAPFFFDGTAAAGQTFFYWVRAENGANVGPLSASDSGSRTGTAQQGPVPPLDPPGPAPAGNPLTATKAYLGKVLFWDEQMSSTRTVSCGTCHHSNSGGTDPRSAAAGSTSFNPGPDGLFETTQPSDDILGSAGVPSNIPDGTYVNIGTYGLNAQVTGRKTVSYVNAAYAPVLFWDGRATATFRDPITNNVLLNNGAALESQAAGPPVSSAEMGHNGRDWNNVASRIAASKPLALAPSIPAGLNTWIGGRSYAELFQEAFGTPDVTPSRIAFAIATFERTLFSDQAPVDLDASGIAGQLTAQEIRGRNIFTSPANNCAVCHGGNRFTDNAFHYIGVRPDTEDSGREQVTGFPNDRGAFRTPSLRNVELRGSYFHNGRFKTLEEVVAFYDRGGDFTANNKPNLIHPLGLNPQQQADLVAFLKRPLTDPRVVAEAAPFDRPTLYTESNRVPQITGTGRAGSGGVTPQIKAISPPVVGNPNFTVSVASALGNANATLVIDTVDPGLASIVPGEANLALVSASTQSTGAGNGWASASIPIPDSPFIVGQTYFARWYVVDPAAVNGIAVSQAAKFTVFGESSRAAKAGFVDFDGDGKTDISIFRPSDGTWWIRQSGLGLLTQQFGMVSDLPVPADFDGDGKTDIAIYREGYWWILRSRDGLSVTKFGMAGDVPQPTDYDGDGVADIAVYRPSEGNWYLLKSRDGFSGLKFGSATDRAVAADYDGDGKADPAIYRDGQWWVLGSTAGVSVVNWGLPDDKPVLGDYDGDGKSDIAVWRPSDGVWWVRTSSDGGVTVRQWGMSADSPTPGDYDGDGRADFAIYRPEGGTWWINAASGVTVRSFGLSTDKPVPSYVVPVALP